MKTETSNYSGTVLEIANQIGYSLKVLIIGLFIPFAFVFGITYKRHDNTALKSTNITKENPENHLVNTVYLNKNYSIRNS